MGRANAVYRATKILKLLAEKKALSLTEVSIKLKIPKSSAFDIMSTLKKEGFLDIKNNQFKKYILGISSFATRQPLS